MGRELYKSLADLSGHFFKLGRNLEASVDAYNKTLGTLESRVLVTARKFKDLDAAQTAGELSALAAIDQSTRALQALIRAARVRAVMAGRSHLDVEDIAAVALPVLSHRVLLRFEGELDGSTEQSVLEGLIQAWRSRS